MPEYTEDNVMFLIAILHTKKEWLRIYIKDDYANRKLRKECKR